jgi:ADP-ribose pyrophosphatase YjhB (NUDIX family)
MNSSELKYAAGVIPYVKENGKIYFLLGYENKKWSGFIGKYEDCDNENIINTAIREFNEETANIFEDYLIQIKDLIVHSKCVFVQTRTKYRIIYIYFVEMDSTILDIPYETLFLEQLSISTNEAYKEKSEIKWIEYSQLDQFDLIMGLKKVILYSFRQNSKSAVPGAAIVSKNNNR